MHLTFVGTGDAFGSGGRYNACLHLAAPDLSWLIDCGASAFLGLDAAKVDVANVSTILVTHFHGDHFAGIPFIFLDGLFRNRRTAPLTLIGPPGIEARFAQVMAALFPGYLEFPRPFDLRFREIAPGETLAHEGIRLSARLMEHDPAVGPCLGFRLEHGGRVLAVSGDTRWTDELLHLSADADLFVCECSAPDGPISVHLTYALLKEKLPLISARRVVLTHMGTQMQAVGTEVATERAYDGLTLSLD